MYASTSIRETSEMKIETINKGGKETYCKYYHFVETEEFEV